MGGTEVSDIGDDDVETDASSLLETEHGTDMWHFGAALVVLISGAICSFSILLLVVFVFTFIFAAMDITLAFHLLLVGEDFSGGVGVVVVVSATITVRRWYGKNCLSLKGVLLY